MEGGSGYSVIGGYERGVVGEVVVEISLRGGEVVV